MVPDSFVTKLLIFFAVVALVGGLWGAHHAGVVWAARQQQMQEYKLTHPQ